MLWALVTRLNDVLAVIGLGTVIWGVVRLTRFITRLLTRKEIEDASKRYVRRGRSIRPLR